MLLTKHERGIGLVEEAVAEAVLAELKAQLGEPVQIRESLASGYVRVGHNYIANYNGRFGCGITVRCHNDDSTRYCSKYTCIWDAEESEIEAIIERYLGGRKMQGDVITTLIL